MTGDADEAEKDTVAAEVMAFCVAEVRDVEEDGREGGEEGSVLVGISVCHARNVDEEATSGGWDAGDECRDLHDLFLFLGKILVD